MNFAHLSIGGTDCSSKKTFDRCNPLTGAVATRASAASVDDAVAAAEAAAAAFPGWAQVGPNARRAYLIRAADRLEAQSAVIVEAMMGETGATRTWSRFNVSLAVGVVREAAALTTQIGGEVIPSDKPGCLALSVREPAGVVLGIAPWNAPVILGARAIAVPLACGNTVVLKGSELSPQTHALLVACFVEARLPAGVVNLINNAPDDAPEVVGALIDHRAVRRINFTGSTEVGRAIAVRAASHLKPVLLELGGKAPFIVLEDADLDEAVRAAAFGAFFNQGQICMSTERIIVVDAVADAFAARFSEKVASLEVGDPEAGDASLGSVATLRTVEHLRDLADDATSRGAILLNTGQANGTLVPPHVLDYVTSDMRIFREESFGPIVVIVRANDEDHAIALANDSDYGLSAAVFTGDAARGLRVARRIRSGICHINGPTVHDEAQMPFGGVGDSGFGRFGGKAGIDAFTEQRWITMETQPGHFPI